MTDSKERLIVAHGDPAIGLNSVHSISQNVQPKDSSALSMFMDFFQPLPTQDEMISDASVVVKPPVSDLTDYWSASSLTENDSVSRNSPVDGDTRTITTQQLGTVFLNVSTEDMEALDQRIDNTIINTFKEEDLCLQSLTWYVCFLLACIYIYTYIYVYIYIY
jgi:hypothetical protein